MPLAFSVSALACPGVMLAGDATGVAAAGPVQEETVTMAVLLSALFVPHVVVTRTQ